MNWLKRTAVSLVVFAGSMGLLAIATPATPVHAGSPCNTSIMLIPAWYDGLVDGECNIDPPKRTDGELSSFIWTIVLNVVEAMLIIAGYVSVAFIIVGGYKYMIATGSPDKIKAAKDTIRNAIIGLLIALGSVAIVNAIARTL